MKLNLTKTYTQKSNAQADIRKAIVRGECAIGEFTVVALSGGFRIVAAEAKLAFDDAVASEMDAAEAARPVAEEATSPAGWRAPEAFSGASLPIAADRAEAEEAFAEMTEASRMSPSTSVSDAPELTIGSPGLARLRANGNAEAIREAVLADQAKALAGEARGEENELSPTWPHDAPSAPEAAATPALSAPVSRRGRKPVAKPDATSAAKPAKPAASSGLSPEATALLKAVFYSPALRELTHPARVAVWVEYKTIHESDVPHGLNPRSIPGLMTGLSRRGLVECRMDKPGKYSARITAEGFELVREAGR